MEKKLALMQHLGQEYFELDGTYYEDEACSMEIDDEIDDDYKVLTDDEANEEWEEALDYYIEECIMPEIPRAYRRYFDDEKWKEDARHDGRGQWLAPYDHEENEETVFFDGQYVTLYIYRIN